jgi:hypothetical protein
MPHAAAIRIRPQSAETLRETVLRLRSLRREAVRREILRGSRIDLLASHILGYDVRPFHLRMIEFQEAAGDTCLQLAPRGFGKSTILTIAMRTPLIGFWIVGVSAVLASVWGSEIRTGPSESPIAVELDLRATTPSISVESAARRLAATIGLADSETASAKFVHFSDRTPFGPPGNGEGWLVRGTVQLSREDATVRFALNVVIDSATGQVVVAYTDASETWVLPVRTPRNADELAERIGWNMGATLPDSMESSAVDAIGAAWKEFGFDPTHVGQLIARPRWISAQFPAREVNGKLVPIRPTQKVWLIQVCGTKMNEMGSSNELIYDTEKVMQFLDGSLTYVRGLFVN